MPHKSVRQRLPYDERREQFVEKAVQFFAREGFESSTRDLARSLGVTQPLLYRYFPSKEDLIREVYEAVYLQRWRDEWNDLLIDRSKSVTDRLNLFYTQYTDVIFRDDWMRIFLFSGLKGIGLNREYLLFIRQNLIEVITREILAEHHVDQMPPSDDEIEFGWTIHGGIFYYGVRLLIYNMAVHPDKSFVIENSIQAWTHQLVAIRKHNLN
jgi:AcrR family transcriptional regulator